MAKEKGSALVYILLLVVGLAVGGAGVYFYLQLERADGTAVSSADAPGEAGKEKKILYYQAPMDPTYIRNEPGKSPMGMDLVPVYESDEAALEPGTVRVDPVTIQNIGVRTKKIERKTLERSIRTVGRVDYDEKRVYHVTTKIDAWVEKLYVDFTGAEVKKDDYLVEIYSPKLVATQEEYLLARSYKGKAGQKNQVPGSGSVLELARRRLELWDVPAHQIKELEKTGRILKTLHIHSPATGVVVKKNVSEGMFVKPGVNLYTIADLSKVWVYADIYEYELSWIALGQEAEMTLAAHPGRVFKGKVTFINPFMEPKTRTVKVRLEFDNPDGSLKPDMYANVTLKSKRTSDVLAVPAEAVLLSGERSVVILAGGEGKFSPKEVELGVEAGGFYEVVAGLEEGDDVVTSAHFLIDSESRLKEAIAKMLEPAKEEGGTGDKETVPSEGDHVGEDGMKHEGMDQSNMKGMDHGNMKGMDQGEMKGMDHEGMKGMDHSGMDKMDHGSMDSESK